MKTFVILFTLFTLSQATTPKPHVRCTRTYRKIGCYKDLTKPLPKLLITDRDEGNPQFEGHLIDWNNWDEYIHSLACRCVAKAKKLNYKVFGLQNFGECWSGPGAEKDYARDKSSQECYSNPCDVKDPRECVGQSGSNYVYAIEDDPCKSSPCTNGGTCSKDAHGFLCACPPNFSGSTCENDVNECLKSPCKNGAKCKNTHGGFDCICPPRYKGKLCDKSCSTPVVDLAILVDGSGSIGNNNFMAVKRYLLSVVDRLGVSSDKTHVAIIYYSDKPHIHGKFSFSYLYDLTHLKLRVLGMPFPDGETRTDLAIIMADEKIFSKDGGDRDSVPDVLMVITDGKHGPGSAPMKDVLKPLKDRGVRMIAVAIDNSADQAGLNELALGNSKNVFLANDGIEDIELDHLIDAVKNSC